MEARTFSATPTLGAPETKLLAGGGGILAGSYVLPLFWSRGVSPIPPCLFHQMTGQPCPFCGATRSIVYMAHGDIGMALYLYPLGPVIFLGVVLGIAYALWSFATGRVVRPRLSRRAGLAVFATILGLLAANWLAKLLVLGYGPLPY